MKNLIKGLLALIIVFTMNSCAERINVGNVGLKVELTGSDRGLSQMEYKTGWVTYTPGVSTVVEYSTRWKTKTYTETPVTLKGGTTFEAHPIITYRVNPTKADKTYLAFGTDNMELVEEGFLLNAVTKALGDVANKFTPDSMLYSRELYENLVMDDISKQCDSFGIELQMVRANLTPPQAFSDAINAKNTAIQQAQTIQNQVAQVEAQARKNVAEAEGTAQALVTQAKAESEANRLRQQTLTPLLIQQQWIEKWKGELPTTIAGNSGVMLSLPISK